jgi:DNA (cytosine-5)-methyltransferase 1
MKSVRASEVKALPLNGAKVVSAYSGCGGLDIGFRIAGFEPIWANDVDEVALETYGRTLGSHTEPGDIRQVEWPDPRAAALVIGGPPCQGFSVAGKMNPHDPRSAHVDTFLDLVEHVEPDGFVMENVKSLATSARWTAVREQLKARAEEELRYHTSLLTLNAADFGTPQRRERMFFIGLRDAFPSEALTPTVPAHTTVGEALRQLPGYGEPGNDTFCTAGITPAKRPVLRPSAFKGSLLFNGNGRPLNLKSTAPTLPASMGGNATPILDQLEFDTGAESWIVNYHRRLLDSRKPLKKVPKHLRRVTVEEAAQLQGFPLEMEFAGTTSAKYRQIGNAVPPPLAYAVACAVAELMGVELPRELERVAA